MRWLFVALALLSTMPAHAESRVRSRLLAPRRQSDVAARYRFIAAEDGTWDRSASYRTGALTVTGPATTVDIDRDPYTFTLPEPFPDTSINFTRDTDGTYSTSFDPDAYLASWNVDRTIYADLAAGNDTTGNGTIATPYKTIRKAMTVAVAAPETAIRIVVLTNGADVFYARDEGIGTITITGKRIAIVPDDASRRIYSTTQNRVLTWALTAGQTSTYQATRSSVTLVADLRVRDDYEIPLAFAKKSSIAEVEATAGSWWQSGSTVYVHTLDGTAPTADTAVMIEIDTALVTLAQSAELFVRGVYFIGSRSYNTVHVKNATGDYSDTRFVAHGCAFAHANPLLSVGYPGNGLAIESIKAALVFNSFAAYNSADGFNFHYTRIGAAPVRDYYSLTFGSKSYSNGLASGTGNNNAFTAHEGAHSACIACEGWNTDGPIFANTNGCNSVLIGSYGHDSAKVVQNDTNSGFWFDNASAPAGVTGAAYLDDCKASGSLWDLSSDGAVPITLRDFAGTKIPAETLADITTLPSNTAVLATVPPNTLAVGPDGALVYGARTSRILWNQALDNAAWVKQGAASCVPSPDPAPDGSMTAWRCTVGTTPSGDYVYQGASAFAASVPLGASAWIKRVSTTDTLRVFHPSGGTSYGELRLDLSAAPDEWRLYKSNSLYQTTAWAATSSGLGGIGFAALTATATFDTWRPWQQEGTLGPDAEVQTAPLSVAATVLGVPIPSAAVELAYLLGGSRQTLSLSGITSPLTIGQSQTLDATGVFGDLVFCRTAGCAQ